MPIGMKQVDAAAFHNWRKLLLAFVPSNHRHVQRSLGTVGDGTFANLTRLQHTSGQSQNKCAGKWGAAQFDGQTARVSDSDATSQRKIKLFEN